MSRPLAGALAALVLACHGAARSPDGGLGPYPGRLLSTRAIQGSFSMRQKVDFRYGERSGSFEAVVQKRCDEVVVVGFTPFGMRGFVIRQRDREVSVDSRVVGTWPFEPWNILLDVHRALFIKIGQAPLTDGVHEATYGDEIIRERWSDGRLQERSFQRASGEPAGSITVTYVGGMAGTEPPKRLEFQNGWYGYRLSITTLAYERFTCAD